MGSWDVVIFSKDNSCEYLPSSWAVDVTKSMYLWPKKLSIGHINKLRDSCSMPSSNIQYEEWTGTRKATVYDIGEARKLAERATYTSNLSSEGERPREDDVSRGSESSEEEISTLKRPLDRLATPNDNPHTPKRQRQERTPAVARSAIRESSMCLLLKHKIGI